jgi:hypothetical protein
VPSLEAEDLTAALPRFADPNPDDPPDPAWTAEPEGHETVTGEGLSRENAPSDLPEPTTPKPRTAASSATLISRGEIAREMGGALTGLLVIAFAAAVWLGRAADGRSLREPTEDDYEAFSVPLGRIGARHIPLDLAPAAVLDLKDAAASAGALTKYLKRGPLREAPIIEESS